MDHSIPERLASVETSLKNLAATVNTMAGQVQEVRDHMLTTKGKSAGSWKALSTLGSIIVGVGVVAGGIGAMAAVLVR